MALYRTINTEGHGGGVVDQPLRPQFVIPVDHRIRLVNQLQQQLLGRAIGFHGAVIVEVIPAQVGEHGGGKGQRRHAMLHQTMAGDLHRHQIRPLRLQRRQIGLHLHGAAGGVFRLCQFTKQAVAYGAHHPGLAIQQGAPVGDQQCRGALAIGAGDPHQCEFAGWLIVEIASQLGEASRKIPHSDAGSRGRWRNKFTILLKHNSGRSLSHRLFDETSAIHLMATNGHEERAGADPPTIQLDIGQGERGRLNAEGAQ